MSLGMSSKWLLLGHTSYFLLNNTTEKWYVERRGAGWAAVLAGSEYPFPSKREAMDFIEATHELSVL